MNFDKPFWRTVLREADGTASAARLFCAAIITSALGWVTYATLKHGVIPDLAPVAAFITATTLALYGVNKVASATQNIFGKQDQ
jgi:hypothetical protein